VDRVGHPRALLQGQIVQIHGAALHFLHFGPELQVEGTVEVRYSRRQRSLKHPCFRAFILYYFENHGHSMGSRVA